MFRYVFMSTILVALSPAGPVAAQTSVVTAFVDVSIIPMDQERVLANQAVVVRDGRITALGPVAKVSVPAGARRVDAAGQFLMPGLADMHAHLAHLPQYRKADKRFLLAKRTIMVMLAHGITTIRIMSGDTLTVRLRKLAATGALLSPRIYTAGPIVGGKTTPETAKEAVAAHKAAGYDFLKVYHIMARPAFDTLAAAAARAGLPIAGHAPTLDSTGVPLALAAHYRSLEHLYGYYGYMTGYTSTGGSGNNGFLPGWEDLKNIAALVSDSFQPFMKVRLRAIVEATREAGVWNTPTLVVMKRTAGKHYPDSVVAKVIKALRDAGAGLLLGTDHSPVCGTSPVYDENFRAGPAIYHELTAMVRMGLTPYEALASGTRNVAEFLGASVDMGTVEVGKRADLVLLDGNPLESFETLLQPAGVMLDGQWLPRSELDAQLTALGLTGQDGRWRC